MANIYVYQGTPPNLAGTAYAGYKLVPASYINASPNIFNTSTSQPIAAGDNVVIGGSVSSNITFHPASGSSDGYQVNVTVLNNTNSFTIGMGDSAGLANYANPSMTVTVPGDAPAVNLDLGSNSQNLTVNVADNGSFGNIAADSTSSSNILTVNVGTQATVGNITGGTDADDVVNLTANDGATIGNITSGSGQYIPIPTPGFYVDLGGADNITLGDNVTTGNINLFGGADSITTGTGTTIGSLETGSGKDVVTIGEANTVSGHIQTGHDLLVFDDDDILTIGANSIVQDYINTNGGDDSIIIGDNVTLNGGSNAINTYLGNDYVQIGSGVVATNPIFTGAGSDTIVSAPGNNNYTVDQGINIPNNDMVVAQFTKADAKDFADALASQGYTRQSNGTYFSGSNSTFVWNGVTYTNADFIVGQQVVCFGSDALIETATGHVRAGDLAVGDMVRTRDAGMQPVRWIGKRTLSADEIHDAPNLRPIRISKGALGAGLPESDLIVSPQHRVLVRSNIAQKMFGTKEVLVAAKQLCQLDGIDIAADLDSVTYVHFLFDAHQIVFSNGAETESLHTGAEAMKSVGPAALAEILTIFPELADQQRPAARPLVSGRLGRKLAVRHLQNGKPLLS